MTGATPPRGRAIVWVSWSGVGAFALTAVPAAAGVEAFDDAAVVAALVLFFASLLVWAYAFAVALARSAHGDDIVVANLFLLQGPAPRPVRWHLFGAIGACLVVTAATAAAEPFGVLVPMWPIGALGLWGARHGTFPARREPPGRGQERR